MAKEQVISVTISNTPDVRIRVINDDDPLPVKESKKKYPFEMFNTINVLVETTYRKFDFDIYNGYYWNGADIPKIFWRLIGSRTDNDFLIASCIHDFMLQFKAFIINECIEESITIKEYRRLTSLIFREKLKNQGTNVVKANIMSFCVDIFQMLNRKSWRKNEFR